MSLTAGILVKDEIVLNLDGRIIEPTIWINLLCESGACKSFTLREIKTSLQDGITNLDKQWTADDLIWIPGAQSTAAFMSEWAGIEKDGKIVEKSRNRSIMVVDEATDFFRAIKNHKSHLAGMYRHFLTAYGHDSIEHKTVGRGSLHIQHPVICFLGLATPGRFIEQITEEDIEGGFYYRWCNKIDDEEKRPMPPIYPSDLLAGIADGWKALIKSICHREYIVSPEAIEHFKKAFDELAAQESDTLPRPYIRRMTWRLHTLALIYHIFLGRGEQRKIGTEPYEWAWRLLYRFTDTASRIIRDKMHPRKFAETDGG